MCIRLDRLELSAKATYYVVRALALLRGKVEQIDPLPLDELEEKSRK